MKRLMIFVPATIFWVLLCLIPDNHTAVLLCGLTAVSFSVGALHLALNSADLS